MTKREEFLFELQMLLTDYDAELTTMVGYTDLIVQFGDSTEDINCGFVLYADKHWDGMV